MTMLLDWLAPGTFLLPGAPLRGALHKAGTILDPEGAPLAAGVQLDPPGAHTEAGTILDPAG